MCVYLLFNTMVKIITAILRMGIQLMFSVPTQHILYYYIMNNFILFRVMNKLYLYANSSNLNADGTYHALLLV